MPDFLTDGSSITLSVSPNAFKRSLTRSFDSRNCNSSTSSGASLGVPGTRLQFSRIAIALPINAKIAESGEEIVITKRGKPVAKLAPCEERPASWFGRDRDLIRVHDDLIEPADVEWEVEANPDGVLHP